jgi:site-specific DNA-methyltransferase (adenine-specific)
LEQGAGVFIRFNEGLSILKKVASIDSADGTSFMPSGERKFDRLVSSLRPFGFRTFFRGRKASKKGDVKIHQNGGVGYVARAEVETGLELIDHWKIYIGRAAPGTGNRDTYPHRILSTPFIGEPGSICSETYLCIGPFQTRAQAESALSYLSCRLTRLLILLHKPSQDTTRKVYTFVPTQTWDRTWTDEDLYAKYGITPSEIDFIEKVVRPMDLSDDLLGDVAVDDADDE